MSARRRVPGAGFRFLEADARGIAAEVRGRPPDGARGRARPSRADPRARPPRPGARRRDRAQPRGARDRRRPRPRAPAARAARCTACPVLLKDNIATGDRMATTAGSLALDGVAAPPRRAPRDAPARRRRGDPRQDQPQRVGQHPLDAVDQRLERPRRPDPQPVRARPQHERLELGLGGGGRGRLRAARRSAPRPTARSCRRRRSAASSGSSRPSASSAATASIPISHTQDTPGPMTRTVADAALLLDVIAGPDPRDPATAAATPPRSARALTEGRAARRPARRRARELRPAPGRRRGHRERAARAAPPPARRSSTRSSSRTPATTATPSSRSCCTS